MGSYVAPDKTTVRSFVEDEWLPTIAHTIRATTLEHYRVQARVYLLPHLGSARPQRRGTTRSKVPNQDA